MRTFFYFSGLFFLYLVVPNKTDLRGHWHVYPTEDSSFGDIEYTVMEIFNDGTGIFDASADNLSGFSGRVNTWEKTMLFGGECLILDFNYKFNGTTLYLEQREFGSKMQGIRCDKNYCDKQKEFFAYQNKINIDLPITRDTLSLIRENYQKVLEKRLLVGYPKKKYQSLCFPQKTVLLLDDRIASEEDIPIWDKKNKIKIDDNLHKNIKIVIYTDKQTSISSLQNALIMFEKLGYKKVYFALRSKSIHHDFRIWLKPYELKNNFRLSRLLKAKTSNFITVENWLLFNYPNKQ